MVLKKPCFCAYLLNYQPVTTFLSPKHPIQTVQAKSQHDIVVGDIWKYHKGAENPPKEWKTIDFDDSEWLEGPSGLGYGNNPKNGTLQINMNDTLTYTPKIGFS